MNRIKTDDIVREIDLLTGKYIQLIKTIAENERDLELTKANAGRWEADTAEGAHNRDYILRNDPDNQAKGRIGIREWNLSQNKSRLQEIVRQIVAFANDLSKTDEQ